MDSLHNHLFHLYLFQSIAKLGSFQATATKYGLPRSSVSKKIQQLEQHVGQRLIQRSTRKLNLTEAGRDLLAASESLHQVVEASQQVVEKHETSPSGRVRISSSTLIGEHFLLPFLQELRDLYPDVSLELFLSDDYVDLIEQEIDIAIRIGHLPDSSLVARKIGEKHWGWYASPAYLQKNGYPKTPEDLVEHDCLVFKNKNVTLDHWPFKSPTGEVHKVKIKNQLATDSSRALVEMSRLGMGIMMIDPILIRDDIANGSLVPVLTKWQYTDSLPINLVCLGRNYRTRASSCIWEALLEHLQAVFTLK
ncbi:LysR family transcriptional regulator [Marinomonas sp. C2222]|uniref:LysR family transcriptional regulator n=1 Tax=Marinomonas sargassi TaxID=2984494 RepID=A0ABT2YPR2_9GAMM|nr:LysR family transcriptional regulator [Marinomonas sargassi]MCV2401836.1 LysR family transcriptional regulator [Marinomonas sargassi]